MYIAWEILVAHIVVSYKVKDYIANNIDLTLKRFNVHILDDEQRACRHCFGQPISHSSNLILEC